MQLYLMRHGETNYNRLGLCNDDPRQDVHLTATGIRQAEAAGQRLARTALGHIVVSELPRTRQTAEIVRGDRNIPITVNPALNDIRSGFDSLPVADYFAATGHDRLHLRANGGESLLDYQARVLPVLGWLARQNWASVLVVAHEETLRVLVAHLRGLDNEAMLNLHFGNCEVVHFRYQTSRPG
jgi:probable phosphoglycerate mutase